MCSKVNNKDICSSVSIVHLEQVNADCEIFTGHLQKKSISDLRLIQMFIQSLFLVWRPSF